MADGAVLAIRQASVTRGGFTVALPKLELASGEIAAVCGMSGCGKSTLLELIGLILKPNPDSAIPNGRLCYQLAGRGDLAALLHQGPDSLARIRAADLGFMPQNGGLLPYLNVEENLRLPSEILGQAPDEAYLDALLQALDMQPYRKALPKQLSIGQRQRAAFIRAAAHKPKLLLADEPTAALDPVNSLKLFELITNLAQHLRIAALIVTHDHELLKGRQLRELRPQFPNPHTAVFVEQTS